MRLIDQLYAIMTNEEFTEHQRKEQAEIVLAEQPPMTGFEDKQPLQRAIGHATGFPSRPGSVRFGLAALCDNG